MAHMCENHMVIWRDTSVLYKERNGKLYEGCIPVANYNLQTRVWEPVVNARGRAYAARKRQVYRKRAA